MRSNKNITTLEQIKNRHFGKPATPKRDSLEAGYEEFIVTALQVETKPGKRKIASRDRPRRKS